MAYEQREGQGSLFRVEEDKKVERGPEYEGTLMVGGVTYRVAGWVKTSSAGKKWLSLKAEVPRAKLETPAPRQQQINPDADIPF